MASHARQAKRLTELGCDYAQGFLFAPPLPASQLAASAPFRAAAPVGRRAAGDTPIGQGLVKPVMPI